MRLIDADKFKQWVDNVAKEENPAFPAFIMARPLCDLIDKQPTIGDGDITPEQVIAAYNVMRKYADNRTASECDNCVFTDICIGFCSCPDCWPDLEVQDN